MRSALSRMSVLIVLSTAIMSAQDLAERDTQLAAAAPNHDLTSNGGEGWVRAWRRAAAKARASQPHFVAPLVTTHVMLVQQFRYDTFWQRDSSGGGMTSNYGSSRGLEIIPSSRLEVGLFPPAYVVHQTGVASGFGDLSYQVKFRAFSATEGKGDYFVGFFLGGSVPTGSALIGLGHPVLSPTFAVAKGLGPWDIQSTFGATLPTSSTGVLGRTLLFNTEVDYRIKGKLWPMLEQNSTFWIDGPLSGNKQVFLTPGVVVGPFSLNAKLHFAFGFGAQTAVSSFHQYSHRWILSIRFPF